MPSVDEIRELLRYYEEELYGKVREEQRIDESYINDTFAVPEVRDPHKIYRSGLGRRMVEAPAEQLVTKNPQAIVKVGNKDAEKRIQVEVGKWLDLLRRQMPNPFKETVKTPLGRGEFYIQVLHNESWVSGQKLRTGTPVMFVIPDSMAVYASPEEHPHGVPKIVFKKYKRRVADIKSIYPQWSNPRNRRLSASDVEWMEYWTAEWRYFEADGEAVLPGEFQKNIYGFVPFVRRYSGFGRQTWDGSMDSLIVSDIRFSRDLIREECALRSDIASILHLFAHRPVTIIVPDSAEVDAETIAQNINLGAYDVNVLGLPPGSSFEDWKVLAPTPEMFAHLNDIRAEINQRNPFLMAGFPLGSSGRQQDLSSMAALRRYETIVENVETAWATAFEMALHICDVVPTLLPAGLHRDDVRRDDIQINIRLIAEDPVERDRKATLGSRLYNMGNGEIDLRTNLIEYQGYSPEQTEEIIVNKLVDRVTLQSPEWAAVVGAEFAREAGLLDKIQEAQTMQKVQAEQQTALQNAPPPTTVERVRGEASTPEGFEMIDQALANRGVRHPPERFTRGE